MLLNLLVSACPGDEGRPPVAPLPPVPRLGPPLACLPAHGITVTDVEGGTAGGRARAHGQGDVLGHTPAAGEGLDLEGGASGRDLGPTSETGPETGTETGDDTHRTGEQGLTLLPLQVFFFFLLFKLLTFLFFSHCRSRSSSRQGGRRRGRSSGSHRRADSDSRSPPQSLNRANHSPSPPHRGAQPSAITVCDKLRK